MEIQTFNQNDLRRELGWYVSGFMLSIIFTLIPLGMIYLHDLSNHTFITHPTLYDTALLFAVIQLLIQSVCFLHIRRGIQTANVVIYGLTLFIVFILVGGSLWIMANLQHNDLSSTYTNGMITPQNEND